jgi:iron complex outermembrane receptor protein
MLRARFVQVSSIALTAATLASPTALHAQDGTESTGEIVVTAQFREQNLQDTPIAITAVSAEMLEARSQTNIAEVANQAPSVTLRAGNANFGPSLAASIRGIGQHDFNPALEPGVGMYVDDVYYPTLTGSIFDLLDLERVEILRGPQGTLAGRNSIGGAIKLYSKRPTGSNTGSVSASYGSRDRIDLRASADFAIGAGVDARLSGVSRTQDGYVKRLDFGCVHPVGSALNPSEGGIPNQQPVGSDCLAGRDGNVNYQAVRGQLRLRPADTIDINIIADYSVDDRNSPAAIITSADNPNPAIRGNFPNLPYDSRFVCGPFCNFGTNLAPADPANGFPFGRDFDGRSLFKGWGVSGQLEWELANDLQLVSITAYREYNTHFSTDDDLSPLPVSNMQSALDFWFFSQELRLNGSLADDAFEYTIGGYYSDQRSRYAGSVDLRWAGLQFMQDDPVPADTKAVFAHASWHLTDSLTLTGGLRYTEENKTYTFHRYNLDGSPNPPLVGILDGESGHYKGDRIDYRANVQYRWTDNLMTYAQFSTGFKGGGINPRPYFNEQVQPFDMETIDAWEIGLKSDFLDRRARLNLSAYFNKYNDIQIGLLSCPQFNPTPPGPGVPGLPCAMNANAGDAEITGFEAELNLRPVDGLTIDGSLSYIDFQYTRLNEFATGPGGVQLDHVPNYTAKWQWSLGAQYEIPLGSAGSLTPRIDAAYKSSVYANAVNAESNRIPSYTVANARLTWRNTDEDLQLSLEVTNLFDKYYYLNLFNVTGNGFINAQPARPREWALTATKRF